jgi:hypothetical protein
MVTNRRRTPRLTAVVVLLVGAGSAVQADPPYWHRVVVDAGGTFCGDWCSLAFDPNGWPAVAYLDGNEALVLARPDPSNPNGIDGAWIKAYISVAGDIDRQIAAIKLAFDPNGYPAIVHTTGDVDSCNWWYTWENSLGWHRKDIPYVYDTSGLWQASTRMQLGFDVDGRPWVVFHPGIPLFSAALGGRPDTPGCPEGEWTIGMVHYNSTGSPGVSVDGALAMTPDGAPGYAFCDDPPTIKYGSRDPHAPIDPNEAWPGEPVLMVPDQIGGCVPHCLAFGPGGAPAITIFPAATPLLSWIYYASKSQGTWNTSLVREIDGLGSHYDREANLQFRYDGNPGISFQDVLIDPLPRKHVLMYGFLDPDDPNADNGVWQFRPVDARRVFGDVEKGEFHSLASDANGFPAIAYRDTTFNCLRYAVTATVPDSYQLTVEVSGENSTTHVEVDPDLAMYPEGTVVTLTAVPGDNRAFGRWVIYDPRFPGDSDHAVEDTNNPLQLLIEYDREVKAVFTCSSGMPLASAVVLVVIPGLALTRAGIRSRRM